MVRVGYQADHHCSTISASSTELSTQQPTIYLLDLSVQGICIIDIQANRTGILAALTQLLGAFERSAGDCDFDGRVGEDLEGWFGDEAAAEEERFPG